MIIIWAKVFKNGPSEICVRQPLKDLRGYGLLKHNALTDCFEKLREIYGKILQRRVVLIKLLAPKKDSIHFMSFFREALCQCH